VTVPLRAVAALFLERQHLARPREAPFDRARLLRFVEDTGGLQLDSINVLDRAHYLAVWSRFGPYDKSRLDALAYEERVLFEYWAHAACLVATTHFPSWRRAMLDYHTRTRGWGKWLKKNARLVERVKDAIRAKGPLGSNDFEARRAKGAGEGWWNWKPTSYALDWLWMSGATLTHSRAHFHKRFDLAERVMPDALAATPLDARAFRHWHVRQSLRAMGAATDADLRAYLSFPRMPAKDRTRALDEMIRSGEVVVIDVEPQRDRADGLGDRRAVRWLALADDLPALERAARARAPSRGTTLLTPFDSFLWPRDRTRRLFGYDFTIECYTPAAKRVYGYYTLSALHDGQLVARIDPKAHRSERRLAIQAVSFEPWFAAAKEPPRASWGKVDRDRAIAGVAETIRSLATFVGADDITLGKVTPRALTAPLSRALT
jgi:uncharacterized protein YcaQ